MHQLNKKNGTAFYKLYIQDEYIESLLNPTCFPIQWPLHDLYMVIRSKSHGLSKV